MNERNPFEEEKVGIVETAKMFTELDTNSPASMYSFINQIPMVVTLPIGLVVIAISLFLIFKGLQIDRIFFLHIVLLLTGCCITLFSVLKTVITKVVVAREKALFDSIDKEID